MNLRGCMFVIIFASSISACAMRSTEPKSTFTPFKQTATALGQDILLTITGQYVSSLRVIESVENVYRKDGIHVVVHTRMPSDKDAEDMKLRLLHTVLIPVSVSRVYWEDEVIWQRGNSQTAQ